MNITETARDHNSKAVFFERRAETWGIQVSSNGMNKRTLLVVPYVLRIPSLKYPNIEFHSKTIKHFALQAFFLVPHFSSAMHFFFF